MLVFWSVALRFAFELFVRCTTFAYQPLCGGFDRLGAAAHADNSDRRCNYARDDAADEIGKEDLVDRNTRPDQSQSLRVSIDDELCHRSLAASRNLPTKRLGALQFGPQEDARLHEGQPCGI